MVVLSCSEFEVLKSMPLAQLDYILNFARRTITVSTDNNRNSFQRYFHRIQKTHVKSNLFIQRFRGVLLCSIDNVSISQNVEYYRLAWGCFRRLCQLADGQSNPFILLCIRKIDKHRKERNKQKDDVNHRSHIHLICFRLSFKFHSHGR